MSVSQNRLQQRRDRVGAVLRQESYQRGPFGEDARRRQRVFAHAAQVFAGDGAGELHARLALLVREVAEHADGEPGNAGDDQDDRAEIDGGKRPRRDPSCGVEAKPRDELAEALQHKGQWPL